MTKEIMINIEIPKNSNIKFEYDRKSNKIVVDRILRNCFKYPANYGYISQTLDWDGDELDVLVYSKETFPPGVSLKVRIIGAMKMIDNGEIDTKLITVHVDDYRLESIQALSDLPKKWLKKIKIFFLTYKNWKKRGITIIKGFEDSSYAIKEYQECIKLYKKYGNMKKNDFIKKMKLINPTKYIIK